jgi:hypothetical protein
MIETPAEIAEPAAETPEGGLIELPHSELPLDSQRAEIGPGAVVRPDPLYHRTILLLSLAVIVLSVVLSVRGGTRVILPGLGLPLPELCMMKKYTNLGCPGCGMTRCFISLGRGDLAAAWSYNPAGIWFYAIVLFQIPYRAVQLWRIRRDLPELRTGWLAHISLGLLAVGMIGQWLLRVCGVSF